MIMNQRMMALNNKSSVLNFIMLKIAKSLSYKNEVFMRSKNKILDKLYNKII